MAQGKAKKWENPGPLRILQDTVTLLALDCLPPNSHIREMNF